MMEAYRTAARQRLRNLQVDENRCSHVEEVIELSENHTVRDLLKDVQSYGSPASTIDTCENLAVAEIFLEDLRTKPLSEEDEREVPSVFSWAATAILPSAEFAASWELAQLAGADYEERTTKFRTACLKSTLGVSILKELNSVIPIHKLDYPVRLKVITALATFSRPEDPWTTEEAFNGASQLLDTYKSAVFKEKKQTLAPLLGDILKTVVKPSFARTKNIAVTPAGRKNEHPVPAPRFDASVFDEASKPWKFKDVYVVTVLSWIVDQYRTSDYTHIEAQFPFLVPPILSLIDDDGLVYKAFGCNILNRLLAPLSEAKSDILRRTNLDSVFQDALHPCLLSLPSLTPENESIRLLQSAYPALFSVIRTRFPPSSDQSNNKPPTADPRSDSSRRRDALSRILRHHLLPSYHHTSNPQPVQPTESESGIASVPLSSYPYPALTTRLFDNIAILLPQLGLHATPHLQGLIPPITETLTNPFGTAHMPLLISAATAAKELVSAGWVRIWRWRGEILGAAGVCWIHLEDDEQDIVREQAGGQKAVADLRRLLRGVVQLSRIAVEEMLREGEGIPGSREWQNDGVIDVDAEYRQFVDADERLKGLLFPDEEGPS